MIKNLHLLSFLFCLTVAYFLSYWKINFGVIFAISLLFLLIFYCFYQKHLQKFSAQLNILRETTHIRGMFVNIASHELRNPMTTIYSSVDLLQNYSDHIADEEKRHLFESIRKSIRRMTKMMDDIVLIGKLQHSQISCRTKKVNILTLCSSVREALEPEKQERRIQIIIDSQLTSIVDVDASLLDLILTNLLNNALKYSDKNVYLYVKFFDNSLVFDVIDQGIGIPKEEIQKLAQLFGRCSNTGNRKGIGIGMFLVAHCVRLHRGTIKVHSQENHGTHFKVTIPIFNV